MKLAAVIFDLNGTVLEDEGIYGQAFNSVLKSLGIDSKTEFPQEKGIGVKENWTKFIEKYGIKTDKSLEELTKETQTAYLDLLPSVKVRAGFEDLVDKFRDQQAQIALATSNTWEQTDKILDTLGLQDTFNVVTTSEEVLYNKPDPGIFTVTADKLGVERFDCLVIEDSPAGVEAAKRAGMKVIAISSDGETEKLMDADFVLEGFPEINQKVINQL